MNEKEIIAALENCTSGAPCKLCPGLHKAHCMTNVMGDALDLIKSYQERFDRIVEQLEMASYDSVHLDMSRPITETWQIIDLDKAIEIVKGETDA